MVEFSLFKFPITTLSKINTLMSKLRNLKLAGKIRKYTDLTPIQKNETRWSSTAAMVARYVKLMPIIAEREICGDTSVVDIIPTARENTAILKLNEELDKLNSVTVALHRESVDLSDVHYLFDKIMETCPRLPCHCSTNSSIYTATILRTLS